MPVLTPVKVSSLCGRIAFTPPSTYVVTTGTANCRVIDTYSAASTKERGFYTYNTSIIGNAQTILSAYLEYATGTITSTGIVTPGLGVYCGSWVGATLDSTDYSFSGATLLESRLPVASSTVYKYTFSTPNLSLINKTGYTNTGYLSVSLLGPGASVTIPFRASSSKLVVTTKYKTFYFFNLGGF